MIRLRYSFALTFLFGFVISLSYPLLQSGKANALSGSLFQAGRIMDDNVFFDGNVMDMPTIQAFLNAKVPICDTNGTKSYSGGSQTRAQWSIANGKPAPPYTCLKDYTTPFYGIAADQYCGAIGYGIFNTAGILYSVGKACNVSPKVLLILLQKEQSLVADDWPWATQYTKATGYGCPDSNLGTDVDANQNGCYDDFEGFFNQVYYAARQYQKYAKQPQQFNFQRNVSRNINYQANNNSCGYSAVFIQNQATAGLYNYTPYQPNAAALNNLYGTGDGCSAYGNRNFWRMYNDWFGNTYGIPYSASFVRESSDAVTVNQKQKPVVWFDLQNTGAQFWKDDLSAPSYYPKTRLMGSWPINRQSVFYDQETWKSADRPTGSFTKVFESDGVTLSPDQHTVFPGQIARFQFVLNNPTGIAPGTYAEHFELVQDGAPNFWVPGSGIWQSVTVPQPFSAQFRNIGPEASVKSGQDGVLSFDFQNTGFQFWKDDLSALPYYSRTRLMGTWPINRWSPFADNSWISPSRPVSVFTKVFESDGITLSSDQHTVWPGQVARFQFKVKYPGGGMPVGSYKENFELVQDGAPNWSVPGGYAWQTVNVIP